MTRSRAGGGIAGGVSGESHYRAPRLGYEVPVGMCLGIAWSVWLFVFVALVQVMGRVERPAYHIDEVVMDLHVPEVEEIEPEEVLATDREEPPPELASEVPQLTLDQLDIALNPGTGDSGGIVGDFSLPALGNVQLREHDLATEEFVDFLELDRVPRPIGVAGFNFPGYLLKRAVRGRIVLLIKLDASGDVLDVALESSDLPAFDNFVLRAVGDWQFTPPTKRGQPVRAKARLPIPIHIR